MTTGYHGPSIFEGIANIRMRNPANVLKKMRMRFRGADGLHDLEGGGSVVASAYPDLVTGTANSTNTVYVATANTVVSASGSPPYSYAWEIDNTDFDILNPTSAGTAFRIAVAPNEIIETLARCTVTDAQGSSAVTNDITVRVRNRGGNL